MPIQKLGLSKHNMTECSVCCCDLCINSVRKESLITDNFQILTQLVGRQEGHPICKTTVTTILESLLLGSVLNKKECICVCGIRTNHAHTFHTLVPLNNAYLLFVGCHICYLFTIIHRIRTAIMHKMAY